MTELSMGLIVIPALCLWLLTSSPVIGCPGVDDDGDGIGAGDQE